MKISTFAASLFYCVALLCVSASAATYTDNMDNLFSDTIKKYVNFSEYSFGRGASIVPDPTAASFSGEPFAAYSQYQAHGATRVEVSIYSHCGTFVCQNPDVPGLYMLGFFKENMSFIEGMNLNQARYCKATDAVYTYEGGFIKQLYERVSDGAGYFGGAITPPLGEDIGYGVNVYYSFDGQNFFRIPEAKMEYYKFDPINAYCYERYSVATPESAKYLRVEINDVTAVPLEGGTFRQKAKQRLTALASVVIIGERLVMGEAFQEDTVTRSFGTQETQENYSSSKAEELNETDKPKGGTQASSEKAETSSKFEGTITSSKSERESSPKPEKDTGAKAPSSSPGAAPPEQSEAAPDETIVNIIKSPPEGQGFNRGVTAYIIVVCGAIAVLTVLKKR